MYNIDFISFLIGFCVGGLISALIIEINYGIIKKPVIKDKTAAELKKEISESVNPNG